MQLDFGCVCNRKEMQLVHVENSSGNWKSYKLSTVGFVYEGTQLYSAWMPLALVDKHQYVKQDWYKMESEPVIIRFF